MTGKVSADMLKAVALFKAGKDGPTAAREAGVSLSALYSSRPYRELRGLPPTKRQQTQRKTS